MNKKWMQAIFTCLAIFLTFSLYLFLRRGYFNLYIVNKAFGSTAAVLAAFTFIQYFKLIRKEIGILALSIAIVHTLLSLDRFSRNVVSMGLGLAAVFLWVYLLGSTKWGKLQSTLGRIAFIGIFGHLVLLKYPGWITWFQGKVNASAELANPHYPPASLFVFIALLAVLLYRKFFLK